jgi:Uri superfamily endonuclease
MICLLYYVSRSCVVKMGIDLIMISCGVLCYVESAKEAKCWNATALKRVTRDRNLNEDLV